MKKYFKPELSVISVLSASHVAAGIFSNFDSLGVLDNNIDSYTLNSATLGNYIKQ